MNDSATHPPVSADFPRKTEAMFDPASFYQQALDFHRQSRFEEAERLYRRILEDHPTHDGAIHFLGMIAFAQKSYEEAIRLIQRSIDLCDFKASYFNNLGVVLKEMGRYEDAKKVFELAVVLDPNYSDARSNLGLILFLLDQSDSLVEHHLQEALRLQPDHFDALGHLCELYAKQERYEEAISLAQRLTDRAPDNS